MFSLGITTVRTFPIRPTVTSRLFQDAIDRVNDLIEEGRLTGVMDDRGKFIYITNEELEAVAKFIKQRGRVSISELAESSNMLINLNPDNKDVMHKKLMSATDASVTA